MSSNESKWARSPSKLGVEALPLPPSFNIYQKEGLSIALRYDSSKWSFNLNKVFSKDARTKSNWARKSSNECKRV